MITVITIVAATQMITSFARLLPECFSITILLHRLSAAQAAV
jgi:hypothetical protein